MKPLHNNVIAAHKYARDVVSGKIVAGNLVVKACQRHLKDLKRSKVRGKANDWQYIFDPAKAERACKFIQMMPHTKGRWAAKRELLILEPWQKFFVCSVFGWVNKHTGFRRFRTAELFVPRKNGKSILAAAIGLYMLTADGEFGAEVYSGATSEKQAWEIFRPAKLMAEKTPEFLECYDVQTNASNLCTLADGSRFEPVIGKPGDGSSPHCALVDEYHEHPTDEMVDTMVTGMGARDQPLLLVLTTAGSNLSGPCHQMQLEAGKVLDGIIVDDTVFALIYAIDAGDDWADPKNLMKANPNYGVSVSEEFLLNRLEAAKNNSRKQTTFKTKHLNVWVGALDAYFNMEKWKSCTNPDLKIEDFIGKRCFLGMDLSSKVDIAALELLFPMEDDTYARFGKYYLPEARVEEKENEHYMAWMLDGTLTITDGEIIDFSVIRCDILDCVSKFQVEELAYDPFQATMLVTELMAEGVPVVEMRPTVLNFSEPMKMIDAQIRAGNIQHDGDPIMTWMMSNVVAKVDAKDNVYPRKEKAGNKIDGPVALMMSMGRCINSEISDINDVINNMVSATV